jgi:Fic family protein
MDYCPSYEITDEILSLASEVMLSIGNITKYDDLSKLPRLRRSNRIRSIHSSLAIENNTLTYQQVSAVLEGKKVLGPPSERFFNNFRRKQYFKTLKNKNIPLAQPF